MTLKFLGIDLGWSTGASGLCSLEWQGQQLVLVDLQRRLAIAEILAWIDHHLPSEADGLIAVDAPTLIPNATGMRLPDRLAHQHFGRYDAGCYPANQGRPFAQRLIAFGQSLEAKGFAHAPDLHPRSTGRYQIEVFPHPAIVHLFGLTKILKYKKGKLADRRAELLRLHHAITDRLPQLEPSLHIPIHFPFPQDIPHKGTDLKAVEDQLDSLICAYVAAHWWYWGREHNWVLGDRSTGYIVVPAPLTPAHPSCPTPKEK